MSQKVFVYDPTASDKLSSVRGIGRYLQILKENFANEFEFVPKIRNWKLEIKSSVFINPFFNFLSPPLTLKRIAHRQIVVIHDLIPLKYPRHFPAGIRGNINIALNKYALQNYDLIITDSEASKRDIVEILKIKDQKVKIIYPCLPKSFLKSQHLSFPRRKGSILSLDSRSSSLSDENLRVDDLRGNDEYCLYVGDATWNKNLVNMAKTIKIANVSCVFVGKVFGQLAKVASEEALREADCRDNRQSLAEEECHERLDLEHPWQKELKEFFELTKDDKRFIFLGFIPDLELSKLYKQATVNLLLSRDEGFGFSYLEAGQFSCPSVLSDIPVLKEISDGNALFADPNNPQDIADKIAKIVSDKNLKNKIAADAKKRSEFFSPKQFREEFTGSVFF